MVKKLCCSFCGRSESEVAKLAAGPGGRSYLRRLCGSVSVIHVWSRLAARFRTGNVANGSPSRSPRTTKRHRGCPPRVSGEHCRHASASGGELGEDCPAPKCVTPNGVGAVRRTLVGSSLTERKT